MKSLLSVLALITFVFTFSSCSKDDELSGGPVPSGRTFSPAVPSVGRSLATTLHVSENGEHIFIKTEGVSSSSFFYSADGGETFTEMKTFQSNNYITTVDNTGRFITTYNQVFEANGTPVTLGLSGYSYILGDNGRVYAYNQNFQLQSKSLGSGDFQPITVPTFEGSYQNFIKAPGKGIAIVDRKGVLSGDVQLKVHVLDEQTLEWTEHALAVNSTTINGCNNLNRFIGYQMMYNNILIAKGCSGFAVVNLNTEDIRYVDFPDTDNAIYTDLRDNGLYMDDNGTIYLSYATYADSQTQRIYSYNGTEWTLLEDYLPYSGVPTIFQAHHSKIFYNSTEISGTSVENLVVQDLSTDTKTGLNIPSRELEIQDSVAVTNDEFLVVVDNDLYKYEKSSDKLSRYDDLTRITHVNILSDGQWIAGGLDKVYLSSDEGKNWTLHESIFFESTGNNLMTVNESRIVNGKLIVVGTFAYKYYNFSTGMDVDKFDNLVIELNGGNWTQADYQFPADCRIACISPTGTIYGYVVSMNSFTYQYESVQYLLNPGIAPQSTTENIPEVITDKGEQIVIRVTKDGQSHEVHTRPGDSGEWTATGSKFTAPVNYGDMRLLMGGTGILTLLFHYEVYTLQ